MDSNSKEEGAKALAKKEDQLRRIYGKLPIRGDLLHRQLERRYFDSGDLALTAAHKSSNIGAIHTGTEHPLAENVSRPSAPVPTCSNVDDDSSRKNAAHARGMDKTIPASQMGQETKFDSGATNKKLED